MNKTADRLAVPLLFKWIKNSEEEMKNTHIFVIVMVFMSVAVLACGASTPTEVTQPVQASPTSEPSAETGTATPTLIPLPSRTPTPAPLQLEIVQFQAWTDTDGNVRVNVLARNPYDFPVAPTSGAGVNLLNGAGEFMQRGSLYFLDGISGGGGFLLPGETIAANGCFDPCEGVPLTEEWGSVEFSLAAKDATEDWEYSTEVEASGVNVSFYGDDPIFDVSGTVTNSSDSALDRISVRINVFDQDGNLVGAAEASAWDVGAGTTVSFSGYGIGQAPAGSVTYEVTALGVNY